MSKPQTFVEFLLGLMVIVSMTVKIDKEQAFIMHVANRM